MSDYGDIYIGKVILVHTTMSDYRDILDYKGVGVVSLKQ